MVVTECLVKKHTIETIGANWLGRKRVASERHVQEAEAQADQPRAEGVVHRNVREASQGICSNGRVGRHRSSTHDSRTTAGFGGQRDEEGVLAAHMSDMCALEKPTI